MHGYPVMQVVQYSVPPSCSWGPPVDTHRSSTVSNSNHGIKKYIIWCLICGGTSSLIGVMFLGVYFLLRSYTSSVAYFETVPTFVPATLLMLTGMCIVSLARRRNRYSYLIKLSGTCGVASALTCALVTVTTTVLHLSRLQTLRQCEYTQKTRTCTCYTVVLDPHTDANINDEARFVFDSTADCGIVHGALYSCLRAIFGLSVAGVLVAVFSCMLVYQLLSHERKKMYWEQLELRCRSLYPEQGLPMSSGPAIIGNQRAATCRCCEQFHCHRNVIAPAEYQWDGYRGFWPPNQMAHNIIPPIQPRDDIERSIRPMSNNQRDRASVGWSWPRMPWQRNSIQRYPQTPSSPDSQYGFSNQQFIPEPQILTQSQSSYGMERILPYNVWGPPPPYSDPNSPAHRPRFQYIGSLVPNQQFANNAMMPPTTSNNNITEFIQQSIPSPNISRTGSSNINCIPESLSFPTASILKQATTGTISDGHPLMNTYNLRDGYSNTLPSRKPKKRIDPSHKTTSGFSQNHHRPQRVNVQNIFLNHNNSSSSIISANKQTNPNTTGSNYEFQNPDVFFNNSSSDIYDDEDNNNNNNNNINGGNNIMSSYILQKYKNVVEAAAAAHNHNNHAIQYSTIKNYEKPIMDLHEDCDENQKIGGTYRITKPRCNSRKLNFNDLSITSTTNDYNYDLVDNNNHIYRNDFNHYYPNTTSSATVGASNLNHTVVGGNKIKSSKNLNITPIKRNCNNSISNNVNNNNNNSNNNLTLLMKKNFNSSDNSLELFGSNNNNNTSDNDNNSISKISNNNNNGNFITKTDDNNNNNNNISSNCSSNTNSK